MKIAQILNGKVHWIFEAEEMPDFPSDLQGNPIVLVDITSMPEVQEGWGYKGGKWAKLEITENVEFITIPKPVTNEEIKKLLLLNADMTNDLIDIILEGGV